MPLTNAISYQGLIEDAKHILYDVSDTPRIDAEVLIQHVVKQSLSWLIAYGDTSATSEHITHFYQLVSLRQQGQPIAYLIGERDFWTLTLTVNEHVLIPRPDTEALVEAALDCLPQRSADKPYKVLDLGTGSGAIALALAKERPHSEVTAVDVHVEVLNVAKSNAVKNGIDNVSVIKSNWFSELAEGQTFDLIASNPPYIEENDPHLVKGDLRFEPSTALVALNDGLADLEHIVKTAPPFLNSKGYLIVEHGYNQADSVDQLFAQNGFSNITLFKDLNGLPRCTLGQYLH